MRTHSEENPWGVEAGEGLDIGLRSGQKLSVIVMATGPDHLDVVEPGPAGSSDLRVASAAIEYVRYCAGAYSSAVAPWLPPAPATATAVSQPELHDPVGFSSSGGWSS